MSTHFNYFVDERPQRDENTKVEFIVVQEIFENAELVKTVDYLPPIQPRSVAEATAIALNDSAWKCGDHIARLSPDFTAEEGQTAAA